MVVSVASLLLKGNAIGAARLVNQEMRLLWPIDINYCQENMRADQGPYSRHPPFFDTLLNTKGRSFACDPCWHYRVFYDKIGNYAIPSWYIIQRSRRSLSRWTVSFGHSHLMNHHWCWRYSYPVSADLYALRERVTGRLGVPVAVE